ncbi:hypothetical protein B0H14DRAFT_2639556 [Mycena olivaceomarginata]|nr:hypothetical protein B0H14DRAFT_2639556 [Mycena olivaceomarginata]
MDSTREETSVEDSQTPSGENECGMLGQAHVKKTATGHRHAQFLRVHILNDILDKGAQPGQRRLREVRVQVGGTQPDGWLGLNLHRVLEHLTFKNTRGQLLVDQRGWNHTSTGGYGRKVLDRIPLNIGNKTHKVLGVSTAGEKISHTVFGERERERERDSLTPTAHDEQDILEEGNLNGTFCDPPKQIWTGDSLGSAPFFCLWPEVQHFYSHKHGMICESRSLTIVAVRVESEPQLIIRSGAHRALTLGVGCGVRLHHYRKLKQHLYSILRGNSGDHQIMFLGPLNTALPTLRPVELFCEGSDQRDEYWGRLLTRPQFVLPTRTLIPVDRRTQQTGIQESGGFQSDTRPQKTRDIGSTSAERKYRRPNPKSWNTAPYSLPNRFGRCDVRRNGSVIRSHQPRIPVGESLKGYSRGPRTNPRAKQDNYDLRNPTIAAWVRKSQSGRKELRCDTTPLKKRDISSVDAEELCQGLKTRL